MKKIIKNLFVLFFTCLFLLRTRVYAQTLKFVQLSDVHILDMPQNYDNRPCEAELLLKETVYQINKIPDIDFVMITGDLINYPNTELFDYAVKQVNALNFPWYYALGNHETVYGGVGDKSELVRVLRENNENYTFEMPYYIFEPKSDFEVIVLDGTADEDTGNGIISEEQLQMLDETLAKSGNKVVLIFLHFPLEEPIPLEDHKILNDSEFKEVLHKYKMPIAVIAGHYHATKITQDNNIIHVASPSLSYCQEFRVITIDNKSKKTVFKFEYVDSVLKGIKPNESRYEGEENDKNITIEIEKKK